MKSLEVSRTVKISSQNVFVWVDLYEGVVGLHFMKEHLNYSKLRKTVIVH
jgi:hypothetical protein